MYSPKIREKYIPILFRLSKLKAVPMTKLVNDIIEDYLDNLEAATRELKARKITNEMFRKGRRRVPER